MVESAPCVGTLLSQWRGKGWRIGMSQYKYGVFVWDTNRKDWRLFWRVKSEENAEKIAKGIAGCTKGVIIRRLEEDEEERND